MKYQNIASFEKHLQDSYPDHLSSLYMVVSPCSFERRIFAGLIETCLRKKEPSLMRLYLNALEGGIHRALEEVKTEALIGGFPVVFLDDVDKQKELGQLVSYIKKPNSRSFLILGASQLKPLQTLYQEGKKEMIVLDLSEEKEWDKERRIKEWLIKEAKKEGKILKIDAADFLIKQLNLDLALLFQELRKAICYVGGKEEIHQEDLKAISCSYEKEVSWESAEQVIWKEGKIDVLRFSDAALFFPFLGQLRYHLQLGAQLSQQELGITSEEVIGRLPHLKKYSVDKYLRASQLKGSAYFLRGLKALYEIDVRSKNSYGDFESLLALFLGKLRV